jgi:hypothetical protein
MATNAENVTLNYSLNHDRGLEGKLDPLPGLYIYGTSEGLVNVGDSSIPYGRVVTYNETTYAGGVYLPTATNQTIAGFSFYQASYQRDSVINGVVGIPADYPVELLRKNAILMVVPETNLSKGANLFYRCIAKSTPGTYDGLGRIRSDADNLAITNVALTDNVATITATAHGLATGQVVTISGLTTTALNGTYTVTGAPTTGTFTFAKTNANIASGADSGVIARAAALSNVRLIEDAVAGTPCKIVVDLPL